uniref:Uncharacterized protein n=1 Tax=Oryza barthii TaxID=65489 RepID=A0A0D3ETI7_9ORYZ
MMGFHTWRIFHSTSSVGECGLLGKKCGTVLPSSLLVNAPAVNAVPVTPSSMMPATRALRCTSDPRHPGRIWTAGVTVVANGGGWTVVAGRGCPWRWRWRWWLTVAAGDGGGCGSGGGGCRRWYLWRRWLKAIIRLTVRRRRRRYVEARKGSGGGEGGVRVRARRRRWEQLWAGIAGESLAEPFGWLTTATPFGVVPLLGGENLASVLNERWRRSTSHPPWGHRFGETSSCKDIVIGLCIGFELQS